MDDRLCHCHRGGNSPWSYLISHFGFSWEPCQHLESHSVPWIAFFPALQLGHPQFWDKPRHGWKLWMPNVGIKITVVHYHKIDHALAFFLPIHPCHTNLAPRTDVVKQTIKPSHLKAFYDPFLVILGMAYHWVSHISLQKVRYFGWFNQ